MDWKKFYSRAQESFLGNLDYSEESRQEESSEIKQIIKILFLLERLLQGGTLDYIILNGLYDPVIGVRFEVY